MEEQPKVPTAPTNTESATNEGAVDPGRNLAIAGIIFAFVFALVGLILSIVARSKSEKAGFKNTLATVGIIISIINMILGVVINSSGLLNT